MAVRKYPCIKFVVVLIYIVIGCTICDRTFMISSLHDGHVCPGNLNFGQALNELQCFALCQRESSCNSFTYNELHRGCRGSFNIFTDTRVCLHSAGAFYYKAVDIALGTTCTNSADCPLEHSECVFGICSCNIESMPNQEGTACLLLSTYGHTCSSDVDCTDPNTECWVGTCECVPGYSLVPSTQQCVEECTTYGSTYIKYIGWDLTCTSDYHSSLDPQQCLDICNTAQGCLSMSYHNGIGDCQVRYCDPVTNPVAFTDTLPEVDTYVRNCQ